MSYTNFVGKTEDVFEIYSDSEMTQVFTSAKMPEEGLTLYVKLVVPNDKAIVLSIKTDSQNEYIAYIHVISKGFEFDFVDILYGLQVESIDGEPVGERTSFTCDESKIYILKGISNYYLRLD